MGEYNGDNGMKMVEVKTRAIGHYQIDMLQEVIDTYNTNATVLASYPPGTFDLLFKNDEDATHFTLMVDPEEIYFAYGKLWWKSVTGTPA